MHNGIGKTLPICIHPIKYLNEPLLPYQCLVEHYSSNIYFINTNWHFIFMKGIFINTVKAFCSILYHVNQKIQNVFTLIF